MKYIALILVLIGCGYKNTSEIAIRPAGTTTDNSESGGAFGKAHGYPEHWWAPVTGAAPEWEILPQAAKAGEVVLSKRNELGKLLSNYGETPFTYRGKKYASLEGFWQATKYPEGPDDERLDSTAVTWKYTRAQVEQMNGPDAKTAGNLANTNMQLLKIDWVTFEKQKMTYHEPGMSAFYKLIWTAMIQKFSQNRSVCEILKKTGELQLLADHKPGKNDQAAWKYFDMWEEIRTAFAEKDCATITP